MKIFLVLFLTLLGYHSSFAQSGRISGTITDNRNEPLTGATVFIVELERGAVANLDGDLHY